MADDHFDYSSLMREALQNVVRRVLDQVARDGLPGQHHFYLSFRTAASGTELPDDLRQRYPEEMTVVLQHQFWDLELSDHGFAVTLTFGGAHQRIAVPWGALQVFYDPSVPFGLRFDQLDQPVEPARTVVPVEPAERDRPASVVRIDQFRKKDTP